MLTNNTGTFMNDQDGFDAIVAKLPRAQPCPFCGHDDRLHITNTHTTFYWIECECGAEMHEHSGRERKDSPSSHARAMGLVIKKWNRRCV